MEPEDIINPNEHPAIPFQREALQRSEAIQQSYAIWRHGGAWKQMQQVLWQAFYEGEIHEPHFETIEAGLSSGFRILWHSMRFEEDTMMFLADALRDEVLNLGYRLYMSDERQFLRHDYVETIERHYLKPAAELLEGKVDQLFGNITIEYRLIDRQPYDLKFTAQVYHDHQFSRHLPYPQLLEALFNSGH
jgi:hypothetical protein